MNKVFNPEVLFSQNLTLVTHSGLFHTDEVMVTGLIKILRAECNQGLYESTNILRTRNEEDVENLTGPYIVYDVFGGQLDHHQGDDIVDGRPLSSIGKVWRWAKNVIMPTFHIDELSWSNIDKQLISPVDITDNTGVMNPMNYLFNAIRSGGEISDINFNWMVGLCEAAWHCVFELEHSVTLDREYIASLPVIMVHGVPFKMAEKFVSTGTTLEGADGLITAIPGQNYKIKMFNGVTLKRKGVTKGQMDGVVFIHKNGVFAELEDALALEQLI